MARAYTFGPQNLNWFLKLSFKTYFVVPWFGKNVVSFHESAFGQQFLRIIASARQRSATRKTRIHRGEQRDHAKLSQQRPDPPNPNSPQRKNMISKTSKASPPKKTSKLHSHHNRFHNLEIVRSRRCDKPANNNEALAFVCVSLCPACFEFLIVLSPTQMYRLRLFPRNHVVWQTTFFHIWVTSYWVATSWSCNRDLVQHFLCRMRRWSAWSSTRITGKAFD